MSTVYMTLFAFAPAAETIPWNGKKTVIITGANRGIGLAAAKILADSNRWKVILACRSTEYANNARAEISNQDNVEISELDLSDLKSVHAFGARWGNRRLDCLAMNAGIHTGQRNKPIRSAQGFEMTVATNHIGHFKLMNQLLPNIKRTQGRIVYVASNVHNTASGETLLGELAGLREGFKAPISMINGAPFDSDKAYRDSKLCNILTTLELSRRLAESNSQATCNCLSPGLIPTTGLFREYNPYLVGIFNYFMQYVFQIAVSEEEGGRRLAYMIDSSEVDNVNGAYYSRKKGTAEFVAVEPSQEAQDLVKARELWNLTELIIRQEES